MTLSLRPSLHGDWRATRAVAVLLRSLLTGSLFVAAASGASAQAVPYTFTDLGTLGGTRSQATSVNALGQVVGMSTLPNGQMRGFLWQAGTMSDLGALGGSSSVALSINDAGQIAGYSAISGDREVHAVRWDGTTANDIGTLGGTASYGNAINAKARSPRASSLRRTTCSTARPSFAQNGRNLTGKPPVFGDMRMSST